MWPLVCMLHSHYKALDVTYSVPATLSDSHFIWCKNYYTHNPRTIHSTVYCRIHPLEAHSSSHYHQSSLKWQLLSDKWNQPPSLPQCNLIPIHDNWWRGHPWWWPGTCMDGSAALNEKCDRKTDNGTSASVQMHTDTHTVDMTIVLERWLQKYIDEKWGRGLRNL